jgi:hypothetical protein
MQLRRRPLVHPKLNSHDAEGCPSRQWNRRLAVHESHGTARAFTYPELRLGEVHLESQETAPLQERRDEELQVIPRDTHQDDVIGEARGSHKGIAQLDASASRCRPAVKALKQHVEQVRAGGATLG